VYEASDDVIIDVIATDRDEGTNQEIEYRILSGNDDDTFVINNKTVSIKVH
jgi:hypothetical protein